MITKILSMALLIFVLTAPGSKEIIKECKAITKIVEIKLNGKNVIQQNKLRQEFRREIV